MKTRLPTKFCDIEATLVPRLFRHDGFVYAGDGDVLAFIHESLLSETLPPEMNGNILAKTKVFVADQIEWRGVVSVADIREACDAAASARSGHRKVVAKAQFEAWCAKNPDASASKKRAARENANANIHACFWLQAQRDGKLVAIVDERCIEVGLVTDGIPYAVAVDTRYLWPSVSWLAGVTRKKVLSMAIGGVPDQLMFGELGEDSACIVVPSAHLRNRPRMR